MGKLLDQNVSNPDFDTKVIQQLCANIVINEKNLPGRELVSILRRITSKACWQWEIESNDDSFGELAWKSTLVALKLARASRSIDLAIAMLSDVLEECTSPGGIDV